MNKMRISTEIIFFLIMELKNTLTELKNPLEGFSSRLRQQKISANLKTGHLKLLSLRTKRMKNSEQSLRDLWDAIKQINMGIMGVQEEKREKGQRN